MTPTCSVVIPHYDNPRGLDLVLTALEVSDPVPGGFEVVVADDGSSQPPAPGSRPYPVQVVVQERAGFRAAAARNLGAASARGEVVCFLDADTVPEPGYLPAMVSAVTGGEGGAPPFAVVAVGRRRHAELAGRSPAAVRDWLRGVGEAPTELSEPTWLRDGYAATDDLRGADDASFRFLISAVLAMPRAFFAGLGGFYEGFAHYGGEDWELAQRCWLAGADLRHVPEAVAWHDGPDLAGRPEDLALVKNRETLQLAEVLTHPLVRPRGPVYDHPDVVVRADASAWTLGAAHVALASWLRDGDVGVWLRGLPDDGGGLLRDPRVHEGEPPPEVLARCRTQVDVSAPVALRRPLPEVVSEAVAAGDVALSGAPVVVRSTRALARGEATPFALAEADVELLESDVVTERWLGRH